MTDEHHALGPQPVATSHDEQSPPAGALAPTYSPVGCAQELAAGRAVKCDMADSGASSARVTVECFSRVDAEVIAAGALLGGGARLETADCAMCPKLTPDVVTVFKNARTFAQGTDERAIVTIENVGIATDDDAPDSDTTRPSRTRWKFRKRSKTDRPAPALSRRDLFLMGFSNDREDGRGDATHPLASVRLGASARQVYLAAHPDPLLPSVVVTGSCTACDVCAQICPAGALALTGEDLVFDPERCVECGECVTMCPENVLALNPRRPGRGVRVLAHVPKQQCMKCGRPLGPHERGVCHNCSTLGTLTSGIWDMYEEGQ